jgi:large subunit ribosomal protein L13
MKLFKTFSQKPTEIDRKWYLIDAADLTLGRLSAEIAKILLGKEKVSFTHHTDNGDFVVVINAKNLKVTGDKLTDKKYYRHSGYQGGLTELSLEEVGPEFAIKEAVKGMLPKNKLQPDRMARLRIFDGEEHAHTAQTPIKLDLKKGAK